MSEQLEGQEPSEKRARVEIPEEENSAEGGSQFVVLQGKPKANFQTEPGLLPPLENFTLNQVLFVSAKSKSIGVAGRFANSTGCAVIIAEKQPLTESGIKNLFSPDAKLTQTFQNDIYAQYQASCANGVGDLKLMTVYPASDAHIRKYSDQPHHVVHETPEDYLKITKPFVESQSFSIEWVYNILDGKAEADRVICSDTDPETGFVLAPDFKWDQRDMENLYMLAIARKRGILSLRELGAEHLPLLKNILLRGKQAIRGKYGLAEDELRVYVHYQPSYYHFHVHFTHLKFDAPKSSVGYAHCLEDIIDNIENIDPCYYQKKTLTFVIKESNLLWQELKRRKCDGASAS